MNIGKIFPYRLRFSIVIVTVLLLSVMALSACAGKPAQPTLSAGQTSAPVQATAASTAVPPATQPPATQPPATQPPAPSDPQQALFAILNAAKQAPPYHISSTSSSDSGATTVITGEVSLPDHFHIKMSTGVEMLIVGDKSYRMVNGSWTPYPLDIASIVNGLTGSVTGDLSKTVSNVQYLGQEDLNGVSTQVYSYTSTVDFSGQTVTSQVKMWVANGLPVHQEIDGDFAGIKSKTVQDITYDPSIKIEAPTP
jgi:hypothetical protein